jgi:hypothetical protein
VAHLKCVGRRIAHEWEEDTGTGKQISLNLHNFFYLYCFISSKNFVLRSVTITLTFPSNSVYGIDNTLKFSLNTVYMYTLIIPLVYFIHMIYMF